MSLIAEQKISTPNVDDTSEQRIEQSAKMADIISQSVAGTQLEQKFSQQTHEGNIQQVAIKALRDEVSNHSSLRLGTDIRQFKQYGPSVYLLFSFIKKVMILFSILAALSLILVFYNFAVGETFPIKASGVAIAFARASLGSLYADGDVEYRSKMLYEIVVVLIMISFFCFWLYWRAEVSSESTKMERELQLPNLNAVVIQGKGIEKVNRDEVEEYMTQFGVVKEVVRVNNWGEAINIACQLDKLEKEIKQQNDKSERKEAVLQKTANRMEKMYEKIESLRVKIKQQLKTNEGSDNLRYFVVLDSHSHQKNAIKMLKNAKPCCGEMEEGYLLKGGEVTIKRCQAQPWGIYWQNQHVGFKQQILPNLLLFLMINIIPLAVILLQGLVSTMAEPVYFHPSLQSNNLPESEIILSTNTTVIGSWCIGNHYSVAMQPTCSPYMSQLSSRAGIYLAISLCLAFSQYLMKIAIVKCCKYFRFKDHAEKSQTITMHLFMNYTVIYVVIALSVQTSLFGAAMSQIMSSFISVEPVHSRLAQLNQYFDYIPEWYADYGFQLVLNYLIIIVLPYSILPLIYFISRKIKLYFANSRPQSPQSMKKIMQLEQFELEQHYASTFMSITVGVVFAGGMPIMFPLTLAALILRYFSLKHLFIYANHPPPITDRFLAKITPTLFMVAIIAYSANTLWALGVEEIFTPKHRLFQNFGINKDSNAHTIPQALLVFLRRFFNTWIIPFIFAIGVLLIIFRKRLSNTWLKILRTLRIREREQSHKDIENNLEMHSMQSDEQHIQRSYLPYNHHYYGHIFQILQ